MRYADTATIIRLSDEAVRFDFNQCLTAAFFDDVNPDGVHLLVHAIPHGLRPKVRRGDWPKHYRTCWFAEMADCSNRVALIDIEADTFGRLPRIDGTPAEIAPGPAESLPAIVTLDDYTCVDGQTVIRAMLHSEETSDPYLAPPDPVPTLLLPRPSDAMLAAARSQARAIGRALPSPVSGDVIPHSPHPHLVELMPERLRVDR
jgi:hypothetical protein